MTDWKKAMLDAADLIEQPGKWTQGIAARNDADGGTFSNDKFATKWCMWGAIVKSAPEHKRCDTPEFVDDALKQAIGAKDICEVFDWNDEPTRTAHEAAEALRKAAGLLVLPDCVESEDEI